MKIYETIFNVKQESSTKKVEQIIRDNSGCQEVLKYLCNPYIKTGLSHVKLLEEQDIQCSGRLDPDFITKLLVDYFSSCGQDGNRREKEEYALSLYSKGPGGNIWKWFVELVATHGNSSAFGVGPNTLKKVGIEVPSFGCQLGVKLSDISDESWLYTNEGKTQRWRISEKIDGTRRLFIKKNGIVEAYSRSGKQDVSLGHITSFFSQQRFPDNRIYDCELVDSKYFGKVESFEVRAKSIGKAARKTGDKTSLIAICFDYFDFDKPQEDTVTRTRELKRLLGKEKPVEPVRLVNLFGRMDGYNPQLIDKIMQGVLDKGGEGLMLQELSSPYIFGRTPNLIKVKRLEEYTGTIVGFVSGRKGTRLENSIAAIICKVEGCTSQVSVGTGLSDYDRELFANNSKEFIGAEVEIEAFSKTIDKDGNTSLCFPVFKRCLSPIFERGE